MMKKSRFQYVAASLVVALAVVSSAALGSPAAAKMVAHKAFYSLELGQVRPGGNITGARGNMGLELKETCDGWTMSQTLFMELDMPDGREFRQDLRFTGWESPDATEYRFFASNRIDNNREDFRGNARMDKRGGPGYAYFKVPENKKIPLPEETMFPIRHTAWLIERAQAGVRLATGIVFDGADGEGPQRVSAFIGPKLDADRHGARDMVKGMEPMLARPGWKIRMAFYALDSRESVPDYEVEVLQLDNGIVPTMLLDYREFTVRLKLERLEILPSPDCK